VRDDVPTICAIAVVAMVIATASHEVIGHGGACLLSGGQIRRLSSVYFTCTPPGRWIDAAGPLGNLACGAAAWLGLRLLPPTATAWRLFAWLAAAFSLYWFAGYLVYAMALGTGDYIFALELGDAPLGRAAGAALGVALYLMTARLLARQGFGRDLRRTAWMAATMAAVLAALLYAPDRIGAGMQAGLEIGAASLPLLLGARTGAGVGPSPAWIGMGALLFAAFAAALGRGLV
jgi:hypothetical protein